MTVKQIILTILISAVVWFVLKISEERPIETTAWMNNERSRRENRPNGLERIIDRIKK